jgi:2,5-diketo-D-gluconate reductase A
MTIIKLHSGNWMPIIGLGTWQLKIDTAETVKMALDLGFRMIDTSSDYHTQSAIGEALKNTPIKRDDIFVVTKIEETDDAYARTLANLEELQQEYVDLTLIHRPPPTGAGEDLWSGLIKAKEAGLTKDIGVSSYSGELIDKLIEVSGEVPVVNQIEWSPFGFNHKILQYCLNKNIAIQAYSPLTRTKRIDNGTISEMADRYDKTPAQIMLRWSLQSGVYPIVKANQKDHLVENLSVFDFELSEEDMDKLNDLNEEYSTFNKPLPYIEK